MNIKPWLSTCAILVPFAVEAAELPSLVCREQQVIVVTPPTLETYSYQSSSLYRFTTKGLFLSNEDRGEYFYNEVRFIETELGGHRFASAHKTFFFDEAFRHATALHSNSTEVRVSQLLCTRT